MTNNLSEEDLGMLRDAAGRFFGEQMPVSAMRQIRDQKHPDGFDRGMWQGMVGMGWNAIIVDEDNGGLGLGHRGMGVIMEAAGHTLAASPLLSTAVTGATMLNCFGSQEQRDKFLKPLLEGELITALAIDEKRRHQPGAISASAESRDNRFILNGSKKFVIDGHVADILFIVARTSRVESQANGLSVFIVESDNPNLYIERCHMVDGRNAANIEFTNLVCDGDSLLGNLNEAAPIIERCLDISRVALAAEMVGGIHEAFNRTIEYLKIRTQFDVPIGSFQALKHRAAEMFCQIELARSAVLEAQLALDEEHDSIARLASLAKAKASSTFELVTNEAIQMHGGIGMTDAEEIGLFLKRARVAQQTYGDYEFHRDRYACELGF
ncbi:MAG: acyl-CoA dehydrogenase family protein [Gammaproteobacteria bacterium]